MGIHYECKGNVCYQCCRPNTTDLCLYYVYTAIIINTWYIYHNYTDSNTAYHVTDNTIYIYIYYYIYITIDKIITNTSKK